MATCDYRAVRLLSYYTMISLFYIRGWYYYSSMRLCAYISVGLRSNIIVIP